MRNRIIVVTSLFLLSILSWSQQQPAGSSAPAGAQQGMPGMDMSGHDMSNMPMKDMPMGDNDASTHAMDSMQGHMDMGPHMKMTALRPAKPGDAERAKEVVEEARKASEHYTDYHVALAEGFKIFHPEFPQKMYHFTNYRYAMEAAFHFNPEHPTSLLYEKHGDDYKLIGVMYTAPKRITEDELDQRIPLSVAQWHEHVNFCLAPRDRRGEGFGSASAIRFEGINRHAGSLRCRWRNFLSCNLQLDGARLPVRKRSGQHLVSRAPARRRRLSLAVRALNPREYEDGPDRTRRCCSILLKTHLPFSSLHFFLLPEVCTPRPNTCNRKCGTFGETAP